MRRPSNRPYRPTHPLTSRFWAAVLPLALVLATYLLGVPVASAEPAIEAADAAPSYEGFELLSAPEEQSYEDAPLAAPGELVADYIEEQFAAALPDAEDRSASTASTTTSLTGRELDMLNYLKEWAAGVASGATHSTVIDDVPLDLIFDKASYTLKELQEIDPSITSILYKGDDNDWYVNMEAYSLVEQLLTEQDVSNTAVHALMVDCPQELYWFDKRIGTIFQPVYSFEYSRIIVSSVSALFAVAEEYANGHYYHVRDNYGNILYSIRDGVDDTGETITNAVSRAQTIAAENAGASSYKRLDGFREAICRDVDYNTTAASNSNTPYGNPWQLVWVFDGDSTTKVVCEGYAKAFQYLCELASIPRVVCRSVGGTMSGGTGAGGGHMWNVVRMDDGHNYLVDLTNCDSGSIGSPDKLFLKPPTSGSVRGTYQFNFPDVGCVQYTYDDETAGPRAINMFEVFSEEDLTLTFDAYAGPSAAPADKPTATLVATGFAEATLANLVDGASYALVGALPASFTASGTTRSISNVQPGTISLVRTGDGDTTTDSAAQEFSVSRAATPQLVPVQPSTYDGTGSIPTTSSHQYRVAGGAWTDCSGPLTELAAGTYDVRVKAHDTVLASSPQTISIVAPAPPTPHTVTLYGAEAPYGTYLAGETVTLTKAPPTGYDSVTFRCWYVNGVEADLAESADGTASFVMSNEDVVVVAAYDATLDYSTDESIARVFGKVQVTNALTNEQTFAEAYRREGVKVTEQSTLDNDANLQAAVAVAEQAMTAKANEIAQGPADVAYALVGKTTQQGATQYWDDRIATTTTFDQDGDELSAGANTPGRVPALTLTTYSGNYGKGSTYTLMLSIVVQALAVDVELGDGHAELAEDFAGWLAEQPYVSAAADGSLVKLQTIYPLEVEPDRRIGTHQVRLGAALREYLQAPYVDKGRQLHAQLGQKPLAQYQSAAELAAECDGTSASLIENGATLYALWLEPVEQLAVDIETPTCGTDVTATLQDESNPDGGYDLGTVSPKPVVSVKGQAVVAEAEDTGPLAWWASAADEQDVFVGTLTADTSYAVGVRLAAAWGSYFDQAHLSVVTVNGSSVQPIWDDEGGTITLVGSVDPVHTWGSWTVVTPATTAAEGLEERTCAGCDAKETRPIEKLPAPPSGTWARIAGNNGYDTMKAIVRAENAFTAANTNTVVIASRSNWQDPLAATALAGVYGGPLLLVGGPKDSLPAQTSGEIARLKPTKVFVVGDAKTVPAATLNKIKSAAGSKATVTRIAGADAAARADAILSQKGVSWGKTAIISTQNSFRDTLSAAPLAYGKKFPIVYVGKRIGSKEGGRLSTATLNALKSRGITRCIIVGGPVAVSNQVHNQLKGKGIAYERWYGNDSLDTSAVIARKAMDSYGMNASHVSIARSDGNNYVDALAGAALTGKMNSVLVLANSTQAIGTGTKAFDAIRGRIQGHLVHGHVYGGTSAISDRYYNYFKQTK